MIVGHAHPRVVKALQEAATRGTSYGAPTLIESQLAQLVKEIYPSIEKLRMVNSGTEATMSAIRVARGYTGRDKIVKFIGCYHGHGDSCWSRPVPAPLPSVSLTARASQSARPKTR